MTCVDSRDHANAAYGRLPTQLTAMFDAGVTSSPIYVLCFVREVRICAECRVADDLCGQPRTRQRCLLAPAHTAPALPSPPPLEASAATASSVRWAQITSARTDRGARRAFASSARRNHRSAYLRRADLRRVADALPLVDGGLGPARWFGVRSGSPGERKSGDEARGARHAAYHDWRWSRS